MSSKSSLPKQTSSNHQGTSSPKKRKRSLPSRIRHWRIDKKLGKGATATVYLGTSLIDKTPVAIKQFSNDLFQNNQHAAAYRKMMMNEAELVGKLIHPNILQTYSVGTEAEQKYLVMEYVEMGNLDDYVNAPNSLGLTEILRIFFQCACALQYSDEIGIIHRDIKPANVLLQAKRSPKITDFGSAMKKDDNKNAITGIGSPAYMSPEQIREQPLNQQTDIYSWGVSLFEMITGHKPFSAPSQYETVYKILHDPPPSLSMFVKSGLPPDLNYILRQSMEKNQENRYKEWSGLIFDMAILLSKMSHASRKILKVNETDAFDWLCNCPSLKMFQDSELRELIATGHIRTVACATPITIQSSDESENTFTSEAETDSSEKEELYHTFLLDGAIQLYKPNKRISILQAGDYCANFTPILDFLALSPLDAYALANTTILTIHHKKIQNLSPIVSDKLNTLINLSINTQRKIQKQRYKPTSP